MKSTRYSKYESSLDDVDTSSLFDMIKDALMGADMNNPYDPNPDGRQTMDELREAIMQALMERDLIPEDMLNEARNQQDFQKSKLYQELSKLIDRLKQEGFIRVDDPGANINQVDSRAVSAGRAKRNLN